MKNLLRKSRIKLIALGVIAMVAIASCSKEKMVPPTPVQNVEEPNNVSIDVLRTYYASLIKVDVKRITYDEKTEQILFDGYEQISQKELTKVYLNNK